MTLLQGCILNWRLRRFKVKTGLRKLIGTNSNLNLGIHHQKMTEKKKKERKRRKILVPRGRKEKFKFDITVQVVRTFKSTAPTILKI